MKISKVNHTSTGVGQRTNEGAGMLYRNPAEAGQDARFLGDALGKRVVELNEKAQSLYSVFNMVDSPEFKPTKEEKETWKKITVYFKSLVKMLVKKNRVQAITYLRNLSNERYLYNKDEERQCSSMAIIKKGDKKLEKQQSSKSMSVMEAALAKGGYSLVDIPKLSEESMKLEALIRNYSNEAIRKAYRKIVKGKNGNAIDVKSVVEEIVIAMADQSRTSDIMKNFSDDEIGAFIDILMKDYYKEKQLEKIIKSIKAKDTKVQVYTKENKALLVPSSFYTQKKRALFEYMIEYASSDDKKRESMREAKKNFIWDYLNSGSADGIVFSETIEEKLKLISGRKEDKNADKQIKTEVLYLVSNEILKKYNECKNDVEGDSQGLFWLNFFSEETQKWINDEINKRNGISYSLPARRLVLADLFAHLYKHFLSYVATKFIDMGKGVYHFTDFEGKNVGTVLPVFADGITSFDYERISAEEKVRRDMATYVCFAVNNFANSVCTPETLAIVDDALNRGAMKKENQKYRDDAKKYIFRFFGGESSWQDMADVTSDKMVNDFIDLIATVRNSTVHFDAEFDENRSNSSVELARRMFDKEYAALGHIYAKKYYSNNVPMFYGCNDIYNLTNKVLYRGDRPTVAAMPAFNRIIARSKVDEFLKAWIGTTTLAKLQGNSELYNKFTSSIYFVLKEIYYYGFLADKNLSQYIDKALMIIKPNEDQNQRDRSVYAERKAYENYAERYRELKRDGLNPSSICEQFMIDFSLQNDESKSVKNYKSAKDKKHEDGFQHFRMLTYKLILTAYKEYISANSGFSFLKNPQDLSVKFKSISEQDFSANITVDAYVSAKKASENSEMLAWYITSHFMGKKQLNHLCGAIRSELKYLNDIDRRAKSTGNRIGKNTKEKLVYFENLLRIFEFTINFCDQGSNVISDYFKDEDDYAEKVAQFVELGRIDFSARTALVSLCSTPVEGSRSGVVGIYYDELNPVVNRNVARATMYGSERLFANGIIKKVSFDDIKEYYRYMGKAEALFVNPGDRSKNDQELLRKFANLKNRVELTDVAQYVDIVNDLYGQLLSWTYLRERDLTYMQLGFQYIKLFWGNCVEATDNRRMLNMDAVQKDDGALLYLIRAMYSHELPMPNLGGGRVKSFAKIYDWGTYGEGLELFERPSNANVDDHDEAIKLRNYIAHFKYFSKLDHSLEELYGDIFSMYFAYDRNLHKSIPLVYKNILAQHKLIAYLENKESDSKPYSDRSAGRSYSNTKWAIKEDYTVRTPKGTRTVYGLEADKLTFKAKDAKKDKRTQTTSPGEIQLPAHDDQFISNVRNIVTFKLK